MKKFLTTFLILVVFSGYFPGATNFSQPGVLIVRLRAGTPPSFLAPFSHTQDQLFDNVYRLSVADTARALQSLRADTHVVYAETDGAVKTTVNAADPLFVLDTQALSKQWYLPKILVHQAWQQTVGIGITIAVVDTGIDGKHEDLSDGRVIGGYASYCQAMSQSVPNDCLIKVNGELAPGVNSDDNGHGTIVAGLIGAIANNNKGIAGIDWNVKLMPIKALDASGSGLASDVATGIKWAADHGAKIINMSVGGQGLDGLQVLQDAITYAYNKGVLIVAAAGNDAAENGADLNNSPVLPVCADGGRNMVIGVAAVDVADQKAKFSNYGSNCIDISAPGTGNFIDKEHKQGVVSTYYDPTKPGEQDLYVYAAGTSVSAPIISGVAGLMMSAFPDLDANAIRTRLLSSVDNIDLQNQSGCGSGSCVGQLGSGRINALKAVTLATTFNSGSLVRDPQGNIFLIEQGLKRPVSSYVLAQRFAGVAVVAASANQLDSFPIGSALPPTDGGIVKDQSNPTVYLIDAGQRRAMSYIAFISRGLHFENITILTSPEITSYPQGADAAVVNGALLKSADSPAVYILNSNTRELLSYFVFKQRNFRNQVIGVLPLDQLGQYPLDPNGFLYPPLDGTLIRGDSVATVYVIQGSTRHGLSLQAFQSHNYRFADVNVLPQSEVSGYQAGPDILN
jgi:hypothetical protein